MTQPDIRKRNSNRLPSPLTLALTTSHAPKGQENLAQGLPWVSQNKRFALKGPKGVASVSGQCQLGLTVSMEQHISRKSFEVTTAKDFR
jgi:hypothetical protein